jgi:hypothetical protein
MGHSLRFADRTSILTWSLTWLSLTLVFALTNTDIMKKNAVSSCGSTASREPRTPREIMLVGSFEGVFYKRSTVSMITGKAGRRLFSNPLNRSVVITSSGQVLTCNSRACSYRSTWSKCTPVHKVHTSWILCKMPSQKRNERGDKCQHRAP